MTLKEPQRREMNDHVGFFHRRCEDIGLSDVAADIEDTDAGIAQG